MKKLTIPGLTMLAILFAIPVFVQDYLHYTALQSGQLLVPGAIVSAAGRSPRLSSQWRNASVCRTSTIVNYSSQNPAVNYRIQWPRRQAAFTRPSPGNA